MTTKGLVHLSWSELTDSNWLRLVLTWALHVILRCLLLSVFFFSCWVVVITGNKGWLWQAEAWAATWQYILNQDRKKVLPLTANVGKTKENQSSKNTLFKGPDLPLCKCSLLCWHGRISWDLTAEVAGRGHQGTTTVLLYLPGASALGFHFPQLEGEPPVSTADVRELPRDSELLESTWYCTYLLLRPYLA